MKLASLGQIRDEDAVAGVLKHPVARLRVLQDARRLRRVRGQQITPTSPGWRGYHHQRTSKPLRPSGASKRASTSSTDAPRGPDEQKSTSAETSSAAPSNT